MDIFISTDTYPVTVAAKFLQKNNSARAFISAPNMTFLELLKINKSKNKHTFALKDDFTVKYFPN